jgi:hypothetical protein
MVRPCSQSSSRRSLLVHLYCLSNAWYGESPSHILTGSPKIKLIAVDTVPHKWERVKAGVEEPSHYHE